MKNLISIDDFSKSEVDEILRLSSSYFAFNATEKLLLNQNIILLFFESSTRTELSFKIAAESLGAKTFSLNIDNSAIKKGEGLIDSLDTINAMNPHCVIIRHNKSGFCAMAANILQNSIVLNAGDGCNEHPTQALIDLFTMQQNCGLHNIKVAICGDIKHSRVAHSTIKLLKKFAIEYFLVSPPTLSINSDVAENIYPSIMDVLDKVDVIILLRLQHERIKGSCIPSKGEYYKLFGLDEEKLSKYAKKNLLIMHPGPINRSVEINSNILHKTAITQQVRRSICVRKAIFEYLSNA